MISPYSQRIKGTRPVGQIKKLMPNFLSKENYVVHIRNLQFYVQKGLVVKKIQRVLEFHQSAWLKKYIDYKTSLRAASTSEFEQDLLKLLNNSCFGKPMVISEHL